ncbi:hypothetical protein CSW47_09615 [Thermus scotoductus]|uniref:Uncharacterized protein n=1 Tax=Thermus scotoductus TaxID=37636 RepID=A0A430R6J1_THESC|nr:hypothetical protein CSW47_09615 [Thermus scotoductus]
MRKVRESRTRYRRPHRLLEAGVALGNGVEVVDASWGRVFQSPAARNGRWLGFAQVSSVPGYIRCGEDRDGIGGEGR